MKRFTVEDLDQTMKGSIIASCQPVVGGPLDRDDMVVAMASACIDGGAKALRIEGAARVAKIRQVSEVPVFGIVKRDMQNSEVCITPSVEDVLSLAEAGADVIAFDATDRVRPTRREDIVKAILDNDCHAMADCSCMDDVHFALALNVDFIGTTLSGYVGGRTPPEPDYQLLKHAVTVAPRVIAEGRYNTPRKAQEAHRLGAWGVTVGTALTRLETITGWFVNGLEAFSPDTGCSPRH